MPNPAEEPIMATRIRKLLLTHELRTGLLLSTLTADPNRPSPTSQGARPLHRSTLTYWSGGHISAVEEMAYAEAVTHLYKVVETLSPPGNRLSAPGLEEALTAPRPYGPPLYIQAGTTLLELLRLREWEHAEQLAAAMFEERLAHSR